MGSHTECWTLNGSEWPSDVAVCSLSDTLETGVVPQRFFLSPKACQGILRRAEKRGKTLPEPLRLALESVATTTKDGSKWGSNQWVDEGKAVISFHNRQDPVSSEDATNALGAKDNGLGVMAFSAKDYGADASSIAPTLRAMGHGDSHANGGGQIAVAQPSMQVRRLTPVECERLQGFPDNYTNIPWRKKDESPDGPRYKALGNSMAVPVMRWIGRRIKDVENPRNDKPPTGGGLTVGVAPTIFQAGTW